MNKLPAVLIVLAVIILAVSTQPIYQSHPLSEISPIDVDLDMNSHSITNVGTITGISGSSIGAPGNPFDNMITQTLTAQSICLTGDSCIQAWPSGGSGSTPALSEVLAQGDSANGYSIRDIDAVYANTYYSASDNSYYLNPSATSNLYLVKINRGLELNGASIHDVATLYPQSSASQIGTASDYWGYVYANNLCLSGSSCKSSWPVDLSSKSCPAGQYVTGVDSNGGLICASLGDAAGPLNCLPSLPSDSKIIFVTSTVYSANVLTSENAADARCGSIAIHAHLPGSYRAMITTSSRAALSVVPSGYGLYVQNASSSECRWMRVATSAADLLSQDGSGNYLENPIQFNEYGLEVGSARVWTNMQDTGSPIASIGTWSRTCTITRHATTHPGYKEYCSYSDASNIHGNAKEKDGKWTEFVTNTYTVESCCTSCSGPPSYPDTSALSKCIQNSPAASLYCVQQ